MYVVYDDKDARGHIVLLIDVDYTRFIVLLNKSKTLKASYAYSVGEKCSNRERKCLNNYIECASQIVVKIKESLAHI
jgi:hypothetical protein